MSGLEETDEQQQVEHEQQSDAAAQEIDPEVFGYHYRPPKKRLRDKLREIMKIMRE